MVMIYGYMCSFGRPSFWIGILDTRFGLLGLALVFWDDPLAQVLLRVTNDIRVMRFS